MNQSYSSQSSEPVRTDVAQPANEAMMPVPAVPLSVVRPPKQILEEAAEAAQALKQVIDAKKRKVMMNGEVYLEYEDWQTIARFYGVTVRVRESKLVRLDDIRGFSASADAILVSTGQIISSADAMCLNDEPHWNTRPVYEYVEQQDRRKHRVKTGDVPVPLFQLRSMAQTRACAKALRNVMAWVVVLAGYKATPAEELTGMTEGREPVGCCNRCGTDLYLKSEKGKVLCKDCERISPAQRQAECMKPLADPDFVQKSVAAVQAKRQPNVQVKTFINGRPAINGEVVPPRVGPQPAVRLMDGLQEDEVVI